MTELVAAPPLLTFPSRRRGIVAFFLAWPAPVAYTILGSGWGILVGGAATAWAAWVLVEALVYPHARRGKRWALLGLAVAGATTYAAVGEAAQEFLWRRAFQLTGDSAVYENPVGKWRILYPAQWGHEEQRVGGVTSHMFHPTRLTPAMTFTVTCRPNVGTRDLALVVEGFFMNLPKGADTQILEREPVALPSGLEGYRVVYSDVSRRIPLKNESLFVLSEETLFFLTVQATPRWFDRNRLYLEKLLYSLELPE